ncbi:hypothetical protein [Lentiprolixibacter aurantiacus]|uniref:DNA primase n=1 Tax=Lentiprolixibacter aurantiacus TaxID=2993939 RepID=A0AAE3MKS8_9FLAO|nr:hypothetical protein [Lentiprolixibacter aurantiacus]MCX2719516.1 hypothetical protein [Lentiprolixibacter aurantiacus]
MRRILVDYKKLDRKAATLLIETYPDGYGDDDIIAFKNGQGELVQAVELRTEDALYLVKISKSLSNFIASFDDTIEKELAISPVSDEAELELNMEDELDED